MNLRLIVYVELESCEIDIRTIQWFTDFRAKLVVQRGNCMVSYLIARENGFIFPGQDQKYYGTLWDKEYYERKLNGTKKERNK